MTGALLLMLALGARAQAPSPIRYQIAFPNAAHHEARVTLDLPPDAVPATGPVRVRMARSSPGRYALHEFSKNVYDVAAVDAATGRPLPVTRPDPYGWDVAAAPGTAVRFSYTLFGDRTDGTYVGIDAEHAHLNLPATLAYVPTLAARPHEVGFTPPAGADWTVATQLQPGPNAVWRAPHLQYLMDSPTVLGRFTRRTWTQGGQQLELAVLHREGEVGVDSLAARTQRVTRTAEAVWGELPRFDYGRYTFLADYLPTASGDGMEHRNSTAVTLPKPLSKGDADHLSTICHEFFHAWNVERLRPADLEPFDFERANMSDLLWLAEGFTTYYATLLLHRAHLIADADCAQTLTQLVQQARMPGAGRFSPIEMSRQAPFVDAARSIDPTNRVNTYVSYYPLGGATGLALDLTLRRHGHSLDELMRGLWREFGSKQADAAPQQTYRLADVQRVLGQVAADTALAGQFFRAHVYGHQPHDWPTLLAPVGLVVRPVKANAVWLGSFGFDVTSGGATVAVGPVVGSPLYLAGLERGDVLTRVAGRRIRSDRDLTRALANRRVGEVVDVEVRQRGLPVRTLPLTLQADPLVEVVPAEAATQPVTAAQKAFRAAWWGK